MHIIVVAVGGFGVADYIILTLIWGKPTTAYQHINLIPAVKHCGGGMMI